LKVDGFYFPADFVVLDTEAVKDRSKHSPVILGVGPKAHHSSFDDDQLM